MPATPLIRSIERPMAPRLLAGVALALVLALAVPAVAKTEIADPSWQPQASERLVKLPADHLRKSLDADFARSELGEAVRQVESDIALKAQTLADLQSAIERAKGDVRTELRHQFLAEKQQYIGLVARRHDLGRKHFKTREKLFEQLLEKLGRDESRSSPARLELMEKQELARKRFAASLAKVDLQLLATSAAPESRYAREHARNTAAIETLAQAIREHPANREPTIDGEAMTKQDYIRQLLADAQAGLALLDQEETILGYMAKLVGLDASALSDELAEPEPAAGAPKEKAGLAGAVDFFVRR